MLGRDIRLALLLAAFAFACVEKASPPVAQIALPAAAHVGVPVLLDGSLSHSQARLDGPPLALTFRWTLESAPDHSHALLENPGLVKTTLVPDVPGTYRVRLIVSDGVNDSAPASVSFAADDACRPAPTEVIATPTAPAVGQSVALSQNRAPSCDVPGAATITAWRWTLVQKPQGSAAALDHDSTAETSFSPDRAGQYLVRVQLTNALGLTTHADDPKAQVPIVAGPCGANPPVVTAVDFSPANPGVGSEVLLSSEVTDADTEPPCSLHRHLSYSWRLSSLPPGSHVALSGADWPTTSFRPDVSGDYVVELVVHDDAGHVSTPARRTIFVLACGAGVPSATVVAPATAFVGEPVPLEAPVADPDADPCGMPITYAFAWSLAVPGGSHAHLDDPARPAPSFVPDIPGTYRASVVVTASTGLKSSPALAAVLVGACGSLAPIATIESPAGAASGVPVRLQANVTDANDACVTVAPFSYAWTFASRPAGSRASLSGADSEGVSPQVAPSFVPDLPGDYQVNLVVRDQAGLESLPATATVTVAACTAPLSATIVAPASAVSGTPTVFEATVADPNAPGPGSTCTRPVSPYSYSWRLVGEPAGSRATLENPIAAAPTLVPDVDGTYEVELVVTDAAGNRSPPARAQLSVQSCRAPLSVDAHAAATAGTGSPVALSATVDDPNAPSPGGCAAAVTPYSYQWALVAKPAGSLAQLNDPTASNPSFVADQPGTYVARVVITDAAGNRGAPADATVDVEDCTAPLQVTANAPAGVATGQAAALSVLVDDPNAPSASNQCSGPVAPYSYQWSMIARPPGSRAALDSQVAASPSFTPDLEGTYAFEVAVDDAKGNESAPVTFEVTAANCTAPLTATIVMPAGAETGSPVAVSAQVADPNDPSSNDACRAAVTPYAYAWTLVAKPAGSATSLDQTGVQSPVFTPDLAGSYTVALQVTDAAGNQSPVAQKQVTAASCTAPLTVSSITSSPTLAGTRQPVTLAATVTDPNEGGACPSATKPYQYAWSLVGRPAGSAATLGAPQSPAPSFTPDLPGTYVVSLEVADAAGNRAPTATASVPVTDCNQPLTVSIQAPAGLATGLAAAFTASVADPNTGEGCPAAVMPYTYRWQLVSRPEGSRAALNDGAAASPSLTADQAGDYEVGLTVTDAAGNQSAPATTPPITAVNCTAAPQVSIDAVTGAETGLAVPLSATVTDANGSAACGAATAPYSYRWSLAAPAGSRATLNSATAANPAFVPDVPGDYGVSVVVTDSAGNVSQTAESTFTAGSCTSAPVATIAPVTGAQTSVPIALTATVNDPNDPTNNSSCPTPTTPDNFLWSLTDAPKGSQASLSSMVASSPTLVPDLGGDYTVSLVVTDALGVKSSVASTTFTVLGCNAAPTVSLASSVSSAIATITATPADPNPAACAAASSFKYAWKLISTPPGYQTSFDQPDQSAVRFQAAAAGTYVVQASVTDALGNVGTATTSLTVGPCSTGPQVAASGVPSAIVGQQVSLSAAVADNSAPDCGGQTAAPFSYAWSIDAPAGSLATVGGGDEASFVADVPGTYAWTVVVTDAFGLTGTASGVVTVRDCTLTPHIGISGTSPYLTYQPVAVSGWVTRAGLACTNSATLRWQVTSAPPGSRASFASPTAASTWMAPDVPNGTWQIELTATDEVTGAKTSTTASVTSNACGSQMPFAAAGISLPFPIAMTTPQPNPAAGALAAYLQNFTGTTTTLQLDASGSGDPSAACAGPLTYYWSTYALPAGSRSFWPTPPDAAKPSFALDQVGDYVLRLRVTDGRFTSAPSFLHIVVQNPLQDKIPSVNLGTVVRWNDSAVDPADGHPSVAYYQLNSGGRYYDLYFTHCLSNCSAEGIGSTWTAPQAIDTNILDANNDAGIGVNTAQVSMVYLGPGMPAVAYHEIQGSHPCSMMYAVYSSGGWNLTQVDTTDVAGWCDGVNGQVEMHLMNGTPAVAYHSHSNGSDLGDKFAVCLANCTGGSAQWVTQWVEHSSNWGNVSFNAGHFTTMYVDPTTQLPRMAYEQGGQGSGDGPLRYATCADASPMQTCAKAQGVWSFKTLDLPGAVDYWNQLAVSPKGTPSIVSDDTQTHQVNLWTCTSNCDNAPGSNWTSQLVQAGVGVGGGNAVTRLQYDQAGLTHITFIDPDTQTLEYAIQTSPGCTGGPSCFSFYNIDTQVDEGHSSFILTPAGSTHVTYSLTTGLKYYPFGD